MALIALSLLSSEMGSRYEYEFTTLVDAGLGVREMTGRIKYHAFLGRKASFINGAPYEVYATRSDSGLLVGPLLVKLYPQHTTQETE